MKNKILSLITMCFLILSMPLNVWAHPGRTDSKGGHYNRKTGQYHYHNGGGSSSGSSSSSSGSSKSSVPKTVYATNIKAKNIPSSINAGEESRLEVSVYPSNAEDQTIYWESSDTSILTVDSTGKMTAVGVGKAVVTAKTSRGTSKQFTITVKEVVAESISIADNKTVLLMGDSEKMKCSFSPENTTDKTVQWSSSDESIITVSEDGRVTANKIGTVTVTATHNELTDVLLVEVKPVEAESIDIILPNEIKINDDGILKIKKNQEVCFKTEVLPKNTTYKDVTWSIDDENAAMIDKNGVFKAVENGKVTVTATASNGIKSKVEIEIYSHTVAIVIGGGVVLLLAASAAVLCILKKKNNNNITTEE